MQRGIPLFEFCCGRRDIEIFLLPFITVDFFPAITNIETGRVRLYTISLETGWLKFVMGVQCNVRPFWRNYSLAE
jgi:hypothetical protein